MISIKKFWQTNNEKEPNKLRPRIIKPKHGVQVPKRSKSCTVTSKRSFCYDFCDGKIQVKAASEYKKGGGGQYDDENHKKVKVKGQNEMVLGATSERLRPAVAVDGLEPRDFSGVQER